VNEGKKFRIYPTKNRSKPYLNGSGTRDLSTTPKFRKIVIFGSSKEILVLVGEESL